MTPVVADATPLIVLARARDLMLLPVLFGRVLIPPAVYAEVAEAGPQRPGAREVIEAVGAWIAVTPLASPERAVSLIENFGLDRGEAEAIALVESLHGLLLADEREAVDFARSLHLSVLRTPGIYGVAKERGLITAVRPRLDVIRGNGFWLADRDYQRVLAAFGEDEE